MKKQTVNKEKRLGRQERGTWRREYHFLFPPGGLGAVIYNTPHLTSEHSAAGQAEEALLALNTG